jgi:4-hydroxy-3-methylbut-2-en-1-yl diphosphate reductase
MRRFAAGGGDKCARRRDHQRHMKLLVLAPLRLEALAVRSALPGVQVRRTGMGRRDVDFGDADAVAVAGLCGAVDPALRSGDIVLGTELRSEDGRSVPCPDSALLAEPLRRLGLEARAGTLYSASRIVGRDERAALRERGILAVDMESAWLAEAVRDRPLAVLRVVVDTSDRRLLSPRTVLAGSRGLWTLRRAAAALVEWAEACAFQPSADGGTLAAVAAARTG